MQRVLQASYLWKLSDVPKEAASPPCTECRAWIEIVNINWGGDDCGATPPGFGSSPARRRRSRSPSAWAALCCGTYSGIGLINVPNRRKTNGFFFLKIIRYIHKY